MVVMVMGGGEKMFFENFDFEILRREEDREHTILRIKRT